jgi:thymidylate synthase ThyX
MPDYSDAGHRDHSRHVGEEPRNPITHGPESLRVTLDGWGPQDNLFPIIYDAVQSNWGESPSRTVDRGPSGSNHHRDMVLDAPAPLDRDWGYKTGWNKLTPGERAYVESVFEGKTLPQILELITFEFTIDGCSRATTHQIVRTRIGAGFMQHGGRDNDWRHRAWTMPETIERACRAQEVSAMADEFSSCITDWDPIMRLMDLVRAENHLHRSPRLREYISNYLMCGRRLYAALVDAGIPWQDARRVLWMGTQTYIHAIYNYQALQGVIGKRGEHVMDWEINCVAQLMMRELRMKCPPVFSKYLVPLSDKIGRDAMAGLDSWTPVGKYDNPHERCKTCGHAKANHVDDKVYHDAPYCSVCANDGAPKGVDDRHDYVPLDTRPRANRPEQNPFWVLAPSSLAGGPVKWIPTNGTYPHEAVAQDRKEAGL